MSLINSVGKSQYIFPLPYYGLYYITICFLVVGDESKALTLLITVLGNLQGENLTKLAELLIQIFLIDLFVQVADVQSSSIFRNHWHRRLRSHVRLGREELLMDHLYYG